MSYLCFQFESMNKFSKNPFLNKVNNDSLNGQNNHF